MADKNSSSSVVFGQDLAIGKRAGGGRYVLKRLLGRGEISEVWFAHDAKLGSDVALKFLPHALLSDSNVMKHLQEENQRNIVLVHPHVVTTFDLVRDSHAAAIVMEYVEGWTLDTLKVDKPQKRYHVDEIEWWIRQLCTALDYAHTEYGIVHSDLKPSNLLVDGHDQLKVTDFGVAQIIRAESSKRGIVKGVYSGIGFLSPQQVMGETPSKLDDVYSLGATIFDLLTGTPPFYRGEVVAQICGLNPPSMTERLRELGVKDEVVPANWEKAVAACLAKKSEDRPQSVVEVQHMLDRFDLPERMHVPVEVQLPITETEPVDQPEPPTSEIPVEGIVFEQAPRRRPLVFAIVITPFVTLIALIAWMVIKPSKEQPETQEAQATTNVTVVSKPWGSLVTTKLSGSTNTSRGLRKLGKVIPSIDRSSGLRDTTFNAGTGANDEVRCLVIQPDGKILAGGRFTQFDEAPFKHIVRLNPDGSLDQSFAPNPIGNVNTIAIQKDGKILIGGESMQSGHPRRRVLRLNSDGSVDQQFGSKVNYNAEVRVIVVQPDGKILVGGGFTEMLNQSQNRIVRLNQDGTIDNTFTVGTGASATVNSILVESSGRILIGGAFRAFNGVSVDGIIRLNVDGSVDPSFSKPLTVHPEVYSLAANSSGIFSISYFPGGLIQVNTNGGMPLTPVSPLIGGATRTIIIDDHDRLVIGGDFIALAGIQYERIGRLRPVGGIDVSFNADEGADATVLCLALQPDGKILAGGAFKNYAGVPAGGIVRLNGDPPAAK